MNGPIKRKIQKKVDDFKSSRKRRKSNRKLKHVMKDSAEESSKVKKSNNRLGERKKKLTTLSEKKKFKRGKGVDLSADGKTNIATDSKSRLEPTFRAKIANKQLGGIKKREARRLKRKVGYKKK